MRKDNLHFVRLQSFGYAEETGPRVKDETEFGEHETGGMADVVGVVSTSAEQDQFHDTTVCFRVFRLACILIGIGTE